MSGPANPACSECISDRGGGLKNFIYVRVLFTFDHVIQSKRAVT